MGDCFRIYDVGESLKFSEFMHVHQSDKSALVSFPKASTESLTRLNLRA